MPDRGLGDPNRLAVLHDLAILDTSAEAAYDDVARLASACCQSTIAAVNFVDDERHWTKAIVGVEGGANSSVSADVSLCAATVASEQGILYVPDASQSASWSSHPLVVGPPFLRFYAGAAIVVSGQPVGVVCVFGDEPRELGEQQREALAALARQAAANLELRRRNTELRDLAVHDPLTGLANRALLLDRLDTAMAQHRRSGARVGILFCDVDGLKRVNDRFGHDAGDRLLCEVADRLRTATRDNDTVARYAGDEFVVVCPGLQHPDELDAIVERVARVVHAPAPAPGSPAVRVSIGAALLSDGETAAGLLRRADEAMYLAKPDRSSAASRC